MSRAGDPAPSAVAAPVSHGWRTGGPYVALMTAASALGFVKLLVFAKVLGVDGLGYYGYVLLVLQFGIYASNWGILNGLNVELPLAYGRRDADPELLAKRALSALGLTAILTAIGYLAVVVASDIEDPNVRTALLLAAATTLLTTLSEFFILVLRARRQLVPLSLTYFTRAALAVALGAIAGALWGFRGAIVSELVALGVVVTVAARVWLPGVVPRRPDLREAAKLVRSGVPLMLSNLVVAGSLTIDRIYVAAALPEQFGQYTFATLVIAAAVAVSSMLNQAVAPQLLFERGGGSSLRSIRSRVRRVSVMIVLGALAGFGLLLAAIALLDHGFLEEYRQGLEVMPILYLGAVASIVAIYGVVLLAARRFVLIMATTCLGVVVAVAGGWLVAQDPSLAGFAWVFTASQLVSAVAVILASELVVRAEEPETREAG